MAGQGLPTAKFIARPHSVASVFISGISGAAAAVVAAFASAAAAAEQLLAHNALADCCPSSPSLSARCCRPLDYLTRLNLLHPLHSSFLDVQLAVAWFVLCHLGSIRVKKSEAL